MTSRITWDLVDKFTFKSNLQVWDVGNFAIGQQVKLTAQYFAGPAPTGYNVGTVKFFAGSLLLSGDKLYQESDPFEATGGPIRIQAFREDWQDPDDFIEVTVYAQRLANLKALVPRINPDGSVTYGYDIDGNAEVKYRGYVEIELYHAIGPNKGDIREKIAGHNLEYQPGNPG